VLVQREAVAGVTVLVEAILMSPRGVSAEVLLEVEAAGAQLEVSAEVL
jgi:hypothetical protein